MIIHKGDNFGKLFVVIEGKTLNPSTQKGEVILQESLVDSNRGGKHTADVVMEVDGVVGVIDFEEVRMSAGSL